MYNNFRHIKYNVLLWKSIIYRIISIGIFALVFGKEIALIAGTVAFAWYYIYDWIFNKLFKVSQDKGFTLWFTGLPCSGKTSLCKALLPELKKRGIRVEHLDGDVVRKGKLSDDLGFDKVDRDKNINRITFVSKLLSRNGVAVLASFVSPYRAKRQNIRESVTNFIEVWVACEVEECARRDVKGMYALAKIGKIKNFTGVSAPYEVPKSPEIIVQTDKETIEESKNKILNYLRRRKII